MTTVVDELILKFSLDPTQFNRAQQQTVTQLRKFESEAKEVGSKTEDATQKMVDGFSRVTKEVLGLGAAFLGVSGLKDLVANTVSAGSALQVQSQYFNTSSEAANRYANAVKVAGGSAEAASQQFHQVGLRLQRLQSGADATFAGQEWLQLLGINPMNYDSNHPENLIKDIVRGANAIPEKRAAIMEGTGVSAFGPLANMNPQDLANLLPDMLSLTTEQAKHARDISAAVAKLVVAMDTVVNKFVLSDTATNAMVGAANVATDLTKGNYSKAAEDAMPLAQSYLSAIWPIVQNIPVYGGAFKNVKDAVDAYSSGYKSPFGGSSGGDGGDQGESEIPNFTRRIRRGLRGAEWTAPYLEAPVSHDTSRHSGFGHFGTVNNDYGNAVNIAHLSLTAQTNEPADFASRFMGQVDSIATQSGSSAR